MPLRFIDNINDNPDIPTAFDMLMEDEVITLEAGMLFCVVYLLNRALY